MGHYTQGVAFRLVIFRWNGSSWSCITEYPQYWWGVAQYYFPPVRFYDEGNNWVGYDQGFTIHQPGTYRIAVRYHWCPNTAGGTLGTTWNWGGAHYTGGVPLP